MGEEFAPAFRSHDAAISADISTGKESIKTRLLLKGEEAYTGWREHILSFSGPALPPKHTAETKSPVCTCGKTQHVPDRTGRGEEERGTGHTLVLPIAAACFKHPLLLSRHLSPGHWQSFLEEPSGSPWHKRSSAGNGPFCTAVLFLLSPKGQKWEVQHKARFSLQQELPLLGQSSPCPHPWIFLEHLFFQPRPFLWNFSR